MDITAIVKELVFTGGSLTVPGLGKFSINRMPAEMDISARMITPPSKIIHFDEHKIRDDGKLSSLLSERYNISHTEAVAEVSKWVKSIREELSENGRAVIESFGTLESGSKGIIFRDDPFIMYSSLLPVIGFKTAKREEPHVVEKIPEKPSPPSEKRRGKMTVPVIVVSFIALAVTTFFITGLHREVFKGSVKSDSADQDKIVFGRPPDYNDSLNEAISNNLDESTLKENALSIEAPDRHESVSVTLQSETLTSTGEASHTAAGQEETLNQAVSGYHIIAGSYVVANNAEKQKQMLENRGFKTIILPPQGSYYMVSLGSYGTLEQVTQVMNSLKSELDIPLWVKKI